MPVVTYKRGLDASGPRVFLALPTGSGNLTAPCVASLMEGVQLLTASGFGVDFCIEAGNCHVDDARNSLVREFLKTDCTDLVFIDDDVGFDPADLVRLVRYDRDVVGGVYPKKQDTEEFPVLFEGVLQAEDDGLVQVQGLPTGFLRIRRHVLQTLSDKAEGFIGQAGDPVPYKVVFERRIEGGKRWSGDYAFCRKWLAEGGRLYADPSMVFTHTGPKTWGGLNSLGDWWRRKHGVDPLPDLVERLKAGDESDETFLALWKAWGNPWAAKPDVLRACWRMAKGEVLETGSGLTTILMAAKGASVTCLEHDPIWAAHTRGALERLGLTAEFVISAIVQHPEGRWYADCPDGAWDLLVCDGPPRGLADRSILFRRVKADCPAIIDDEHPDGFEVRGA